MGFSDLSMPGHTRRRCDHAFWDSVHKHDRVWGWVISLGQVQAHVSRFARLFN